MSEFIIGLITPPSRLSTYNKINISAIFQIKQNDFLKRTFWKRNDFISSKSLHVEKNESAAPVLRSENRSEGNAAEETAVSSRTDERATLCSRQPSLTFCRCSRTGRSPSHDDGGWDRSGANSTPRYIQVHDVLRTYVRMYALATTTTTHPPLVFARTTHVTRDTAHEGNY